MNKKKVNFKGPQSIGICQAGHMNPGQSCRILYIREDGRAHMGEPLYRITMAGKSDDGLLFTSLIDGMTYPLEMEQLVVPFNITIDESFDQAFYDKEKYEV